MSTGACCTVQSTHPGQAVIARERHVYWLSILHKGIGESDRAGEDKPCQARRNFGSCRQIWLGTEKAFKDVTARCTVLRCSMLKCSPGNSMFSSSGGLSGLSRAIQSRKCKVTNCAFGMDNVTDYTAIPAGQSTSNFRV